jgi:ATP-binding cassette subfamily F protein uup
MLQRVADGLLWLDGNGGAHHLADYEQYERRKQAAEAKRQDEPAAKPAKLEKTPANGKNSSPNQKRKKLSYKEQLEFDGMEDTILAAEAELEQLQAQLANPKAQADHQEANRLYQAMGAAQEKVSKLYERWEELEAKQQPGG